MPCQKPDEPSDRDARTLLLCGMAQYGLDLEITQGINLYRKNRRWALTSTGHDHSNKPDRLLSKVDGVFAHVTSPELADKLAALKVPVINLSGLDTGAAFPRFHTDNQAVGAMAARFFLDRGHTRFLYVCSEPRTYQMERWRGFRDTLALAGKKSFLHIHTGKTPKGAGALPGRFEPFGEGLRDLAKPVAVFCPSDGDATSLIDIANQWDIKVPEEMAVLGVGNHAVACESAQVPLSSVEMPGVRAGFQLAGVMDAMMRGQAWEMPPPLQPSRIHERASTGSWAVADPAFARVLAHLREHLAEPIRVSDLPKRFHLSPRGFYRHFKEQVGRTPRQELIRLRVEAARDLLATTDLYVGEVSDRCGFPDAEAMTRAFRVLIGKTPSGYRDSLRVG